MSCEFHIGQKVVCVDANSPPPVQTGLPDTCWGRGEEIVNGAIYTITDIWADVSGAIGFALHEVSRSRDAIALWASRGRRAGYGAFRFRPLDDSRYDISIFQNMCVSAGNQHVSSPSRDEPGSLSIHRPPRDARESEQLSGVR